MLVRACEVAASSDSLADSVTAGIRKAVGGDDTYIYTYKLLITHVCTGFPADIQPPSLLDF